jgi:hypothetical protein
MEKAALEFKMTTRFVGGETMPGIGLITARVAFELMPEQKIFVMTTL